MSVESPDEPGAAGSVIVVRQSRAARDGLFAVLLTVFALAFARGFTGAQTPGGRVAVAVFIGVVASLLAWMWARSIRHPCHLEISGQAITCVGARSQPVTLTRRSGDELRMVTIGGGRYRSRGLTVQGSGTVIPLPFFSAAEIRRQCVAQGWRFAPSSRRQAR